MLALPEGAVASANDGKVGGMDAEGIILQPNSWQINKGKLADSIDVTMVNTGHNNKAMKRQYGN